MPFKSLIGNERIKKLLKRAVAEDRIGQGLIMSGHHGVGKRQYALALAQALNCERPVEGDACGTCLSCRKIESGEHPDVTTITRPPDKQFIVIEQMRDMSRNAQFRPYEGNRRVYIIDDAHRLRTEAANSILKILEEPPETSLIILVTPRPYMLLETIRSRCQILSFAPLTVSEMESYLKSNFKRPAQETQLLARLARGSIGRAMEIDLGVYSDNRKTMLELAEALTVSRDSIKLMNAGEYLSRKLDRPQFEDQMDVLMVIFQDVFHLKLGLSADSLTNVDIKDRLTRLAEGVSVEQITNLVDRFEQILRDLTVNINRQIALESLFVSV